MPLLEKASRPREAGEGMPLAEHPTPVTTVPEQSRGQRRASFDVADFPMPTGREEDWRFTPMDRIGALLRDTPSGAHLAVDAELPAGVTLTTISSAQARALGVPAPQDRAAALAFAHTDHSGGVMHLNIPADTVIADPVRIRFVGSHSERVWGHLVVSVGAHSNVTVVLSHEGTARLSELVSTLVGDGAQCTQVSQLRSTPSASGSVSPCRANRASANRNRPASAPALSLTPKRAISSRTTTWWTG